jgi:uncharacterized membrane protein YbaN (DUF454 family)
MQKIQKQSFRKLILTVIGSLSLALGIIGVILPVLPTTPFILFSAWCFYRGSDRFHNWIINHAYFGPIIKEYGDSEGMTIESKVKAIGMTWTAVLLTAIFVLDSFLMRTLIIIIAGIGTIFLLKIKTRKKRITS